MAFGGERTNGNSIDSGSARTWKQSLDEDWLRSNAFMTIRPLQVEGTLDGASPFAGLLPGPGAAAEV